MRSKRRFTRFEAARPLQLGQGLQAAPCRFRPPSSLIHTHQVLREAGEAERRALEACLHKLPHEQRELVRSAYAPGVRIDALAARLGRTAMSLYKSLHRIRLILMECTRRELAKEELA